MFVLHANGPHEEFTCRNKLINWTLSTYLHPMRRESQSLLVAPKHLGTGLDGRSGEQLVKVGHLILAVIADQDQHGPLAGHHRPLDERPDAGVELLADHGWFCGIAGLDYFYVGIPSSFDCTDFLRKVASDRLFFVVWSGDET